MRLHIAAGSPFARVIRIWARENAIPLAEVEQPLRTPDSPLLAVTPVGRVPTLELPDGSFRSETTLILHHFGALPQDGAGMQRLAAVLGLMECIAYWNRELRRPPSERSPGFLAVEEARADRIADALEREVEAFAWPAADAIALACLLGYERRHSVWKWREGRPRLAAWFEGVSQHPSFTDTLPPPSGI
ncbi:MAG: glutathione S-transferase family protein [Acetobacteraceae bacterium]|nr:glutathione S-transferase family protein [Acetobacteraceae bacterium]